MQLRKLSDLPGNQRGDKRAVLSWNAGKKDHSAAVSGTGDSAGQEVELTNGLSATHNVLAKVGGRLVIKAEQQEGLEPYYSVFNYDRGPAILGTLVAFAALMCAVGGTKRAPCAAQGALGAHGVGRVQRDFTRSTTYWATNRPNSTTCEMR